MPKCVVHEVYGDLPRNRLPERSPGPGKAVPLEVPVAHDGVGVGFGFVRLWPVRLYESLLLGRREGLTLGIRRVRAEGVRRVVRLIEDALVGVSSVLVV